MAICHFFFVFNEYLRNISSFQDLRFPGYVPGISTQMVIFYQTNFGLSLGPIYLKA